MVLSSGLHIALARRIHVSGQRQLKASQLEGQGLAEIRWCGGRYGIGDGVHLKYIVKVETRGPGNGYGC